MSKFYLIQMSRGHGIPIDADELPNVLKAIQSKQPVIVKQGIFNPAYFVSVIEDFDRVNSWNRDLGGEKLLPTSSAPLKDLFADMRSNLDRLITAGK